MSGRRLLKISAGDLKLGSDRSANKTDSIPIRSLIHCARIDNTWSWRHFYRSRTPAALQLLRTCLLVCRAPQSMHLSDGTFFHNWRLDAVGSCCWQAFRAKRKRWSGRESTWADHSLIVVFEEVAIIVMKILPCDFRPNTWSKFFVLVFVLNSFRAISVLVFVLNSFRADCLFSWPKTKLSICGSSENVACQIFRRSSLTLFCRLYLSESRSFIAIVDGRHISWPPVFLGSSSIFFVHVFRGISNQSLTALMIWASRFWAIHVYDMLYIRRSNAIWLGIYIVSELSASSVEKFQAMMSCLRVLSSVFS